MCKFSVLKFHIITFLLTRKTYLNTWHRYRIHANELDEISDSEKRQKRLVELNVIETCINLYKTATIQKRLLETHDAPNLPFNAPKIHAVVFDPADGKLQSLQVNLHLIVCSKIVPNHALSKNFYFSHR